MRTVAVLFARADSIYKALPGCDVYDIERDARTWPGGTPIVAHPPCRAWGRLKHFAKPAPGEREHAIWAVEQIRRWGGVLEHPSGSSLWPELGLPLGKQRDAHGGWTLIAPQRWWGHKAEKLTRFYIVGVSPQDVPPIPLSMSPATHVITQDRSMPDGSRMLKTDPRYRPNTTAAENELTPPMLAEWLVELARRTKMPEMQVAA